MRFPRHYREGTVTEVPFKTTQTMGTVIVRKFRGIGFISGVDQFGIEIPEIVVYKCNARPVSYVPFAPDTTRKTYDVKVRSLDRAINAVISEHLSLIDKSIARLRKNPDIRLFNHHITFIKP